MGQIIELFGLGLDFRQLDEGAKKSESIIDRLERKIDELVKDVTKANHALEFNGASKGEPRMRSVESLTLRLGRASLQWAKNVESVGAAYNKAASDAERSAGRFGSGGLMGKIAGGNLISGAISSALGAVTGQLKEGWQAGLEYNKMLESGTVRMSRFFETANQTNRFIADLQKFAEDSTVFEMPQTLTGAQRLLDMKFNADAVVVALNNIGDAVGGTGGNVETIDRITLALKQMHDAGRVGGDEMRQLTEAGLPAWELLAKAIGKTAAETKRLVESGGGVALDVDRAIQGIVAMMGERYAGQGAKAGNTLAGLESQLDETARRRLGKSTEANFQQYKDVIRSLLNGLGTEGADRFSEEVNKLLGGIGATAGDAVKKLVSGDSFKQAADVTKELNALADSANKAAEALQSGDTAGAWNNTKKSLGEAKNLLGDIKTYVESITGQPLFKVETTGGGLSGLLGAGKRTLYTTGAQAGQSAADGVKQAVPKAEEAGKALGSAIEKGVRDQLDMHSPSRVMEALGLNAAKSFWDAFNFVYNQGQSNLTAAQAKNQLNRAESNDWIKDFKEAAKQYKVAVDVLLAIASRETNMRNIIGDGGRGAGLMQIDIGTDPTFKTSGAWKDASASIQKGAEIFREKIDQIVALAGKEVTLKDRAGTAYKFTVPKLEGDDLIQAAIASYNSGLWSVYQASKGRSMDRGTTGGDYSTDVLGRAEQFRSLLASVGDEVRQTIRMAGQVIWGGEVTANITGQRYGALPMGAPLSPNLFKLQGDPLPDLPVFATNTQLANEALKLAIQEMERYTGATNQNAAALGKATSQAGKFGTTFAEQWQKLQEQADQAARSMLDAPEKFKRFEQFKDRLGADVDDVISSLIEGQGRWRSAITNIANDFFHSLVSEMMLAATGGKYDSVGGILGGLVGGVFKGLFGGGRASGGDVTPGRWYMVGEHGPEPFIPRVPGYVMPNHAMAGAGTATPAARMAPIINNTFNVQFVTKDYESFRHSELQVQRRLAQAVQDAQRAF